jgi:hypothetical protein
VDLAFGLLLAGVAAVALLLFSDDPFASSAAAVAVCFAIGTGWSRFWRWYDGYVARRGAPLSAATFPWPLRALLYVLLLAFVLSALLKTADLLFLRESTAQTIFYVLLSLGAVAIMLGEFATRSGAQGKGRPSQSS